MVLFHKQKITDSVSKNTPKLDAIQTRILRELTKTEIARTILDELFQGENKW